MLQGAIAGLGAGGLYAILAVCLTLMARLGRVINFSLAATGMFGAFASAFLSSRGVHTIVAAILGVLLGAALSVGLGLVVARLLASASINLRSAATVATLLSLIALSFIAFGTKPLPFTPVFSGAAFQVGGVSVSQVTIVLVLMAVLVAGGARALLTWTPLGTQLRALSERPLTAELVGINTVRLSLGLWACIGAIATFAILIVAPTQSNDASSLSLIIIPAAAAALVGGFTRLDGATLGGLLLGVLEGTLAQVPGLGVVRHFIPFIFIVLLLLWAQRKEVWDDAR